MGYNLKKIAKISRQGSSEGKQLMIQVFLFLRKTEAFLNKYAFTFYDQSKVKFYLSRLFFSLY